MGKLEEGKHSPIIYCDEQRIMQVLLSIQSNALKFTKKGSVKIRVEIEDREEDQFLKVSVIDTGVGIPYEDQDKLFKLFGFIQNTEHGTSKGIGLGLVISENIVMQFNGQIDFKSVPAPQKGHGSEFYFTF